MGFNSGPPMISGAYNNNLQILQTPGYVVIVNEMVHNARIIPTDGRPHGKLRQFAGDSRGRWEGDTLVVETTNFLRETSLTGSTADTQLVERFTRVDPDTIIYEFRVEDPDLVHTPVERQDAAAENGCAGVRVRLPRGQLRPARHHGRSPRQGQGGSGRGEEAIAGGHRPERRAMVSWAPCTACVWSRR